MSQSPASADKWHHRLAWAVVMAESTHVFCCVLPTVVTLISVLASLGVMVQAPVFLLDLHDLLHDYELPIIAFSGGMLALGWVLYAVSRRISCQKPHCEPHVTVCTPHKTSAHKVLVIASIIFLVNVTVYTTVHVGLGVNPTTSATSVDVHNHGHDHSH